MYPILDTRVECKGFISASDVVSLSIRIEPDWNVKVCIRIFKTSYYLLE